MRERAESGLGASTELIASIYSESGVLSELPSSEILTNSAAETNEVLNLIVSQSQGLDPAIEIYARLSRTSTHRRIDENEAVLNDTKWVSQQRPSFYQTLHFQANAQISPDRYDDAILSPESAYEICHETFLLRELCEVSWRANRNDEAIKYIDRAISKGADTGLN